MSIDAMAYAWKTELSGSAKLMLLAIADRCDEFGMCFPGVDKLAKKCGIKKRAAQKLISKLEELGELVVIVGDGTKTVSGKTNRYFMKKYRDSLNMKTPKAGTRDVQTYTPQNEQGMSKRTLDEMSNDSPDGVSDNAPNTKGDSTEDTSVRDNDTQPIPTLTDFQAIRMLVDALGVLATQKDNESFGADFEDYTVEQWQQAVETFKQRRKEKNEYLPYNYLASIVKGIASEAKQLAIIEAEKVTPSYHKPAIIEDAPIMSDSEAQEFAENARKALDAVLAKKEKSA